jgi:hypothetical protein
MYASRMEIAFFCNLDAVAFKSDQQSQIEGRNINEACWGKKKEKRSDHVKNILIAKFNIY